MTVTAGADADAANESVSLTHSAASTDSDYQGITIAGVAVTVTDNDDNDTLPGVTVSPTALTVTEEDTTGAGYTVVLDSQPTATVTVTVAGHAGTTDVTLTPSSATLTFTPMIWGTAQTVTVTAGADADAANESVSLTHSAASTDTDYDGISIDGVAVTVRDNDTAPPPPPPAAPPAAPQHLRSEPGDAQVTLRWAAPTSDGGSPILRYEYAVDDSGTWIDAGGDLEETVPGLTNGQRYTVAVRAVNAAGVGPAAEVTATPVTTPGAPQDLRSEPGDAQVTLRWEAPTSDGGSPILRYEYAVDDSGTWIDAGGDLEETVPGLTNGQRYTVAVRAVNAAGVGPAAEVTATPVTTPGAPQDLRSEPGDAQVTLRWEAPTSDGGSAVLRYEYAVDDSGTWIDAGGDLEATVRDLTSGQSYAVAVRAVNAAGAGPAAAEADRNTEEDLASGSKPRLRIAERRKVGIPHIGEAVHHVLVGERRIRCSEREDPDQHDHRAHGHQWHRERNESLDTLREAAEDQEDIQAERHRPEDDRRNSERSEDEAVFAGS